MKLPIQKQTHVKSGTYINKDSVDVVGAVVALEGGDVRTEVVGWKKNILGCTFFPIDCHHYHPCHHHHPWHHHHDYVGR